MPLASFHRARRHVPGTTLFSVVAVVFSTLSSLAFVGLILMVGLFVELFASRGNLELDPSPPQPLAAWVGPTHRGANGRLTVEGAGLVPWAMRLEGTRWENVSRSLIENVAPLRSNRSCLAWLVAVSLVLVVVHSICLWIIDRMVLSKAAACTLELRRGIAAQAFQLGGAELPNRLEPPATELFAERTETVRYGLVAWWRTLPRMPIVAGMLLLTALVVHVWLAIAAILLGYVFWTVYTWTDARVRGQRVSWGDRAAQQMTHLLEGLRKVRLARGLSLPEVPGYSVSESLDRYRREAYVRDARESVLEPLAALLILTACVLVLAIAGANILQTPQRISFAAATVLFLSLAAAWLPLRRLYRLRTALRRGAKAASTVFQYLDREPKVGQLPQAVGVGPMVKALAFEAVTFSDGAGRRLLDDVSFSIPADGSTAIVCLDSPTRQAVAALLGRYLDPAAGRILYDGQELRSIALEALRTQLALVMEEDWIFSGTVEINIHCGSTAYSARKVQDAARKVHLTDAVMRLPQGFGTAIGEHGMTLPPVMRWRVALARTLLRNPAVVVIEEPAIDVDGEGSPPIDETLRQFARNRTVIYLPTRLATLRSVDRVLVLHDGKLHAAGRHADLLQESELYRHWNYLRFNPFR